LEDAANVKASVCVPCSNAKSSSFNSQGVEDPLPHTLDVTQLKHSAANGQQTVTTQILDDFFGDPAPHDNKNFNIELGVTQSLATLCLLSVFF
jgi:hypothetical protein